MKLRYFLFLCAVVYTSVIEASPFRIGTYNVENLFDTIYQGTEYPSYVPRKAGWNDKTYRIKLEHIAEVLCDMDADIVGLQEIESERAFEALREMLRSVGCSYRYGAITHKKGASVQTALLSRYPLLRTKELHVSFAPKVRNILEVLVDTPGEPVRIFVNHWKSKAKEGWESKRIAYARVLKKRLEMLDWHRPFIVLGDFNSDYNAFVTLEKRNDDTQGRTGINTILPTMRGNLPVSEADMRQKGARWLYDLWYELPLSERWSQKFYGKRSTPDHILLNPALFDGKGVDYVNNSFKVFKADYLFTSKGYIRRWEVKHGKHTGRGYSDHLPLVATFDTVPYRPSADDRVFEAPKKVAIDALYDDIGYDSAYRLENVAVVYRYGRHAILAQQDAAHGIFVYGSAASLKEGECYDVLVEGVKEYKGLKEVTGAYVLQEHGRCDTARFVRRGNAALRQGALPNEVVTDVTGVYKHGYLYLDGGGKVRIYFKKRRLTPPQGSRLKIDYARLGYYKGLEIVIESKRNFHTTE